MTILGLPSEQFCLGETETVSAVHLERSVLPEVPIRHWIYD
jgi:hypothetical protein